MLQLLTVHRGVFLSYSHLRFVRSAAGVYCAAPAGPGMIPRYTDFQKSKGYGSPWLPRRIWGEVVHNPGAGAYLRKKIEEVMSSLWPGAT